jgi:sulfur-carrier protein
MTVRTLFFASYRDLVGTDEVAVPLPPEATLADLVASLRARGERWSRLPAAPVAAVNLTYVPLDTVLSEGDEVALIPPVSGG